MMQLSEIAGEQLNEARANAENAELQARLDAVTAERDRFRRKYNNAHRTMRRYGRRINQLETTLKGTTTMNDNTNAEAAKNIIAGMIGHADNLKTALDTANTEYAALREAIAAECASLAVEHDIDITTLDQEENADE